MTATGAPPAVLSPATFLVDFGRHDGGTNGTATVSPDVNGNYWNNLSPAGPSQRTTTSLIGTAINNMVTVSNDWPPRCASRSRPAVGLRTES
jgi:hypothetical protein